MPKDQKRKHEGYYFVVVDGVPQQCQWQELKDYLRQSAKVRPGHTNVIKVNEDGTRVGFCPVANKYEANKAFDFLVAEGWRGLDIRVSVVWKSDLVSQEIQRRRGPEASRRRRPTTHLLPHFRAISNTPHTGYRPYGFDHLSGMPPLSTSNEAVAHSDSSHNAPGPLLTSSPPFYSRSACHSPHVDSFGSLDDGGEAHAMLPSISKRPLCRQGEQAGSRKRRTIHMSRLSADTTRSEVREMLARYGSVSTMQVWQKRGKYCEARATYSRPTEAALAIRELDGCSLKRCHIRVRLDEGEESGLDSESLSSECSGSSSQVAAGAAVATSGKAPLIVNGALRGRSSGSKESSAHSGRSDRRGGVQDDDSGSSVGYRVERIPWYKSRQHDSSRRHLSPSRGTLERR